MLSDFSGKPQRFAQTFPGIPVPARCYLVTVAQSAVTFFG